MKSEPWARLTRFMMPKTRVSPAAIRNSMMPYCSPFSPCSSTSSTSRSRASAVRPGRRKKGARAAPAPLARRSASRLPLHPAVLGVGVLVALEDRLLDLHGELALGRPHGFQKVEVLDREVVQVVLVGTARRLVVGLPHGGDHRRLVREARIAFLMPCVPCACAAILRPAMCASSAAAFNSSGVNCGAPGLSPFESTPPVAMILITSTPYFTCARTTWRIWSTPSAMAKSRSSGNMITRVCGE